MDTKDTLAEIYQRLDRAVVFAGLNPKQRGQYLDLDCPKCGERRAYIYRNGITLQCNRGNECGEKVSIWDYVQQKKGLTNADTLKELARLAGYSLPETGYPQGGDHKEYQDRETVLETALAYFKGELFKTGGETALAYLHGRGYTDEEIKGMDIGFYPSQEELRKYLNTVNGVNKVNSADGVLYTKNFGATHKLVIPYRDYVGRLEGFIVRSLLTQEELDKAGERKYKYSYGLKPSAQFFNLDKNLRTEKLVVVEGYLDALIATQRGSAGVVAVGGDSPREDQLSSAVKHGAKRFIFALDSDEAGIVGTERALNSISKLDASGYVLTLPAGVKDPDELIKKSGIDTFNTLIDNAETGHKWKARRLLSKLSKQGKQDIERDNAIDEAIKYAGSLLDPIGVNDFLNIFCEGIGLSPEQLSSRVMAFGEKRARERQKEGYATLLTRAQDLLKEGKIEDIASYMREELPRIQARGAVGTIGPYTLDNFTRDIKTSVEGLRTGFSTLDEYVTIPQEAITIIAGRPSHGKTTFILNVFLNMLELYPEKRFFFFSYEETKKQLALKCINILGNYQIDQYKNILALENYVKADNKHYPAIENAKETYKRMSADGRLWLIDEPYFIEDLTSSIVYLKERYPNTGAIFIDYIQKIKAKDSSSTRQVVLQKISEALLETAKKTRLPIILGAQLGRASKSSTGAEDRVIRLDNLRESGDIEQDANLVLGLYNEAMQKAQDDAEETIGAVVDLSVRILKNRNGTVNKEAVLSFDRPKLKISSKTEG